ncbi:MAG: hypothetical protein ACI3WU_05060 [Phascolarctobacterium sp.]
MKIRLKKYLKQTGVAMTEYAILLAFVAAIGASFTSDSGLSSSIRGAVSKVVSVFGYFGGYKEVAVGNQPQFIGFGSGSLAGIKTGSYTPDAWSWKDVYTDDDGQEAASAFLGENSKSGLASGYAKELLDQLYDAGSFGGVDPMSWAFTEGYGTGTQSLNLFWSNSNWSDYVGGSVPVIQMNQEPNGNVQYYVAMANVGSNGSIDLFNQAAALKGNVTYYGPDGVTQNFICDPPSPGKSDKYENSSVNLNNTVLAFSDFNEAQKVYYDLVSKNNIQTQNNYKP